MMKGVRHSVWQWVVACGVTALLVLMSPCCDVDAAESPANVASFDHHKTRFPLTGAHQRLKCEQCHNRTDFKGAPRRCEDCHKMGGFARAAVMPQNHIRVRKDACADCHITMSFSIVPRVEHSQVIGFCTNCHNNVVAQGKPKNHLPTNAMCSVCHLSTTEWLMGGNIRGLFDHTHYQTLCTRCHNNVTAPGKPPRHFPTHNNCEQCHGFTTWKSRTYNHDGVVGKCASCHNGTSAMGRSARHRPTGAACENCHISTRDWYQTQVGY